MIAVLNIGRRNIYFVSKRTKGDSLATRQHRVNFRCFNPTNQNPSSKKITGQEVAPADSVTQQYHLTGIHQDISMSLFVSQRRTDKASCTCEKTLLYYLGSRIVKMSWSSSL